MAQVSRKTFQVLLISTNRHKVKVSIWKKIRRKNFIIASTSLMYAKCGLFEQVLQVTKHPLPKRTKPPVHFYQTYYIHYIHTSEQRVRSSTCNRKWDSFSPHARKQTGVFHLPVFLTRLRKLLIILYYIMRVTTTQWYTKYKSIIFNYD